jgi:hypothetical protein
MCVCMYTHRDSDSILISFHGYFRVHCPGPCIFMYLRWSFPCPTGRCHHLAPSLVWPAVNLSFRFNSVWQWISMGRNGWNWKIDGARHQLLSLIMLNLPLIFLAPPEPHPGEKKRYNSPLLHHTCVRQRLGITSCLSCLETRARCCSVNWVSLWMVIWDTFCLSTIDINIKNRCACFV